MPDTPIQPQLTDAEIERLASIIGERILKRPL
jgi:hypothetical protein